MKITKEQYEELEDIRVYGTKQEFHTLLEKYTDIVAHPYIAYQYVDCADNYVGDSDNFNLRDLLTNAYITIEEPSKYD